MAKLYFILTAVFLSFGIPEFTMAGFTILPSDLKNLGHRVKPTTKGEIKRRDNGEPHPNKNSHATSSPAPGSVAPSNAETYMPKPSQEAMKQAVQTALSKPSQVK